MTPEAQHIEILEAQVLTLSDSLERMTELFIKFAKLHDSAYAIHIETSLSEYRDQVRDTKELFKTKMRTK